MEKEKWEKEFEQEFQWLFEGRIMFDTLAGVLYLNVELTRNEIKQFIQNLLTQTEKECEEKISKLEQIRCDEMLRKQKSEIKKMMNKKFKELIEELELDTETLKYILKQLK